MLSQGIYVVAAKRTAFGAYGGKLLRHSTTQMQEQVCKGVLLSAGVNPDSIDSAVMAMVGQTCPDALYSSRYNCTSTPLKDIMNFIVDM